jgi:predicted site-specific integrase-resolvase
VISEVGNPKLDSEEIFEEIVSLLHCYSMKLYSKRKRKTVEDLILPTKNDDE